MDGKDENRKEDKLWNPQSGLAGQVAIVTGGSRGLGEWIAIGLAQAGSDVVVASRTLAECERVARRVQECGRRALAWKVDVTHQVECEGMIATAMKEFNRLDILVNNAGGGPAVSTFETTEDDFDRIIAANLKGTFFCSVAAARVMAKNDGGRIVNIGSTAGHLIRPATSPQAIYGASKAAVSSLTRSLAFEWAPKGIRVNCVAPGFFATQPNQSILADPARVARFMETTPLNRVGEGRDIVGAVLFMASDLSRFITGQTIFVDGGRMII